MNQTRQQLGGAIQTLFELHGGSGDSQPVILRERGDICANRHKGAETSVQANKVVRKEIDAEKVYNAIKQAGNATLKEVCVVLGKTPNQISGRFTFLVKAGRIEVIKGEAREGCRVYRIK